MPKFKRLIIAASLAILMCAAVSFQAQTQTQAAGQAAPVKPRPIEMKDILGWKSISFTAVSNDGAWFAWRLTPAEGNSEVVFKQLKGDKEYRFSIGESGRSASDIAFSEDAKWAAYTAYPEFKEAKKLRKDKKKITAKTVLLNLATGDKIEFDKAKRFSFSGENPGWIAVHKLPSESQEKEKDKDKDKWSGSDLILRELASAKEWNIGNVSEFAFDKKGTTLAWIIDALDMSGNGIQIRDLASGVVTSLDSDKAVYNNLSWSEKGEGLSALKGKEDKEFEDKLNSLVAFSGFPAKKIEKISYDPKEDKSFPAGMTLSANRAPSFSDNLDAVLIGIAEMKKKTDKTDKKDEAKAADEKAAAPKKDEDLAEEDTPDLVIWHWLDKRLQSQQKVEETRDKNFSYLSEYRIKEKKFLRLADDDLRNVQPAPKQRWAIGLDNREYELMSNLDGRRYQDVYVVDMLTGSRKLALKKNRWYFGTSPEGTHFLYYDDGHFFTYDLASGQSFNITQGVPASFINVEDDHNVVKPPRNPVGWLKDAAGVLLSDGWDIWNIAPHGGKAVNLTVNGTKDQIRYQRFIRLDPEEKGTDLTKPAYVSIYGEWTKKSGFARIENGKPGPKILLWDDAGFSALLKAKKAEVYLFTRETYKDFPDYYVSDALLQNGKRVSDANPQQKDIFWTSGAALVDYKSKNGDRLQGALFLPANYEKGKSYPAIVYYYEKMSQGLNRYTAPSANGFNKSVYNSLGYAVFMPDIVFEVNDPGLSSAACILPAVEAAVATGVVDKNRLGCHGHSWGGYQTAFLVTQTDLFKAAVAGAPLTNMISMYSSIYWNTGSTNQPTFESSQGRFSGGYWENLDAYTRNSPVYYAERVKTPLIIMHNDKDGAVDWNQGIEYFNALRRQKKPVIMLEYPGENHSLAKAPNQRDYTVRMREFFDHYLLGKPAPKWLTDGIPYLQQKDHVKEQAKELRKSVDK